MFVLIYTGKDISESSYFKDEKTNKVITWVHRISRHMITDSMSREHWLMITWALNIVDESHLMIIDFDYHYSLLNEF